jgi:sulfotransferase
LLSALLNQNPVIYSSPLSPINSYLWEFEKINAALEIGEFLDGTGAKNLGKQIIHNYYAHINKSIVIDREKSWGSPANFYLAQKYITPRPKIIYTYRPILEILTSFIDILPEYSFIDKSMENEGWVYKTYLSKNDNRCDYLMQPNGQIHRSLMAINEINKKENKDLFCLINYNDLINKPQATLFNLYEFLDLPNYEHNFNKIVNNEKTNYVIDMKPQGLHDIRTQLKKISKDPKEILSEYIIAKYSNIGYHLP